MKLKLGRPLRVCSARFLLPVAAFLLCAIFLVSAPDTVFSPHERAAYLDPKTVSFVRPGLVMTIIDANIAQDGTITAHFKLTDKKGLPLDRTGVTTPGSVSTSFVAAYIPQGQAQYVSYTTRTQTSPINNVSAMQAAGESNGKFAQLADGDYTYTFSTKAPATLDRTVTHTVAMYGSRNLSEFDLGTQYDDAVYSFVPDGSAVKVTRDVIRTESCNKCHYDMGFHGGSRKTMEVCVLCHTPQTTDPDTGNTVDLAVMVHKIHQGAGLPSVQAGKPYQIIGNRQSVSDYSDVVFPANTLNCQVCHEQGKAAEADAMFKPNRAACGSCHDNVNFATGENHANLPQVSDNQCASCHPKEGELEFDTSILGAHTVPTQSKTLPGVVLKIVSIADATPGQKPTVTFAVADKAGNPIPPSKMDRLSFRFAGATNDYTQLVSEDARKATGPDGAYTWTFVNAIPADAKGTWTLGMEGRTLVKLLPGTTKEQTVRDSGLNVTMDVSVDGAPVVARRTVVATAQCNACHYKLQLHGDARNTIEECLLCHNPTATAGEAEKAQPIDLAVMVHKIHAGKSLSRPYVIGNTSFNDIGYPGQLTNCAACHVNNSQQLPLADTTVPVKNPNGYIDPMMTAGAACTACHDTKTAASHVAANTNSLGESCAVCHGPSAAYSVDKVHAQ